MANIRLLQLTKRYPNALAPAVDQLDLHIDAGELIVLLGASGCGKTTTLKMINRLIEPSAGVVDIDGQDAATLDPVELRRSIGYVIQHVGLFPHWTVAQNVAAVPWLKHWPRARTAARVDELLELVHLPAGEFRARYPRQLSGGQRQRVGLARALAAEPRLMLMDEPLGALDPLTRDALQEEYLRLHRELKLTTVMVTHDMTEALLLADRIVVMDAGRLVQCGSPWELLHHPAHDLVRQMIHTPQRQTERLEQLLHAAG